METLDLDRPLYIGMVTENQEIARFHLHVWLTTVRPPEHSFVLLRSEHGVSINPSTFEQTDTATRILLFNDPVEHQKFKKWWSDYQSRYGFDPYEQFLPEVSDGHRVSGHIVKHQNLMGPSIIVPRPQQFFNEWCWIVKNTTGKVFWTWSHWIFEDSNDAVLHKLIDGEYKDED